MANDVTLPSKRIWLDTGNTWGINMTAPKRVTFPVAEWRHNLKRSNFRHTRQHKVCTDGIHACIEYCCKEQLSCNYSHTVCNNVCTVDKDWPMMDRPTLSSEREHEDTKKVVPQNCICCSPCISLWFLVNDQLDTQFFSMCLFQFSKCFEQSRAHHQENQLYQ